jgi:hypothetical protein
MKSTARIWPRSRIGWWQWLVFSYGTKNLAFFKGSSTNSWLNESREKRSSSLRETDTIYSFCPGLNGQSPMEPTGESKYCVKVLNWSHAESPVPFQQKYDHSYKRFPQQPCHLHRNGQVLTVRVGMKSYLYLVAVLVFLHGYGTNHAQHHVQ